jgi:hypothetical protein
MMMSAAYSWAIVLAFGSCTAATVFLKNAPTRGEFSLPESSEVLQLKGEPGRELRLRVVHSDERMSEESERLRLDFQDPPAGIATGIDVPIRKGWGKIAVITVPRVPGEEDLTVSGFLSGVIELDTGAKKQLEVPLQLRIAPESVIGPSIEPLLSEPTADLLIFAIWVLTFAALGYVSKRYEQL